MRGSGYEYNTSLLPASQPDCEHYATFQLWSAGTFTERATEEFNVVPLYSGLLALALNDRTSID